MTYQDVLNFALKAYGEATMAYAIDNQRTNYENMCFWQEQVWHAAKDAAENGGENVIRD